MRSMPLYILISPVPVYQDLKFQHTGMIFYEVYYYIIHMKPPGYTTWIVDARLQRKQPKQSELNIYIYYWYPRQ